MFAKEPTPEDVREARELLDSKIGSLSSLSHREIGLLTEAIFKNGDPDAASRIGSIVSTRPRDATSLYKLAMSFALRGDEQAATRAFESLIMLSDRNFADIRPHIEDRSFDQLHSEAEALLREEGLAVVEGGRNLDEIADSFLRTNRERPTYRALEIAVERVSAAQDLCSLLTSLSNKDLFEQIRNLTKRFSQLDPEQGDVAFIAYSSECLRRLNRTYPRFDQKISTLAMIQLAREGSADQSLITAETELRTGGGKSLLLALIGLERALRGKHVHNLTQNSTLAARDDQVFGGLYEAFQVTHGFFQFDGGDPSALRTKNPLIVYSTLKDVTFERQMHELHGVPYLSPVNFQVVLADEADWTGLDTVTNSCRISQGGEAIFPEWRKMLTTLKQFACERDLTRLIEDREYLEESSRIFLHRHAYLTSTPIELIGVYLRSAARAESMEIGKDYLLEDGKVLVIDRETTARVTSSQWSNGLYEMVSLREGCLSGAGSLMLSSLTYPGALLRYEERYLVTGTIGDALDQDEQVELYGAKQFITPDYHPRQLKERPTIGFLTNTLRDAEALRTVVAMSHNRKSQPLLIIAPTINEAEQLYSSTRSLGLSAQLLTGTPSYNLHNETRVSEEQLVSTIGREDVVTLATKAAGRGVDARLSQTARINGGLIVYSTTLFTGARDEAQIAGRAARQDDPGEFQRTFSLSDPQIAKMPPLVHTCLLELSDESGRIIGEDASAILKFSTLALSLVTTVTRRIQFQREKYLEQIRDYYINVRAGFLKNPEDFGALHLSKRATLELVWKQIDAKWMRLFTQYDIRVLQCDVFLTNENALKSFDMAQLRPWQERLHAAVEDSINSYKPKWGISQDRLKATLDLIREDFEKMLTLAIARDQYFPPAHFRNLVEIAKKQIDELFSEAGTKQRFY